MAKVEYENEVICDDGKSLSASVKSRQGKLNFHDTISDYCHLYCSHWNTNSFLR